MRAWLYCLSGLIIWAGHFFALYFAASFFPGSALSRWASIALTFLALGFILLLIRRIWKRTREQQSSRIEKWLDSLAGLGAAIAAIGIVFQALPAVIG